MTAPSILGTGSYVPKGVVTNSDLARCLETSDEWIRSHIGIAERHVSRDETTSDMAVSAARLALSQIEDDLPFDGIIVATQTPDKIIPATACIVQHRLGLEGCFALDINAACTGFVYGTHFALGLLRAGLAKRLLLIGAERMSRLVDWEDRTTCVIFGDGAGAAVLGAAEQQDPKLAVLVDSLISCDGSGEEVIQIPAGGTNLPLTHENLDDGLQYVKMDGRRVFDFAVDAFVSTVRELADRAAIDVRNIHYIIPHQANLRIIDAAMQQLGMPKERAITHIDHYGNTSAASVPIALDECARAGRFESGQMIALVAFGTGLTWGGALVKWMD